ncbi:MAG: type II toxin-antitoxin system VapC family toxin [Caldilineae bacterium]|nr:MAG: type II toxin-antitoxin system VapC family toxin [Caldilineae bacterium]
MKPETVFVDTNLFLRYLTNDVPEQADAVERLLRRAMAGEVHLLTNELVIAEIVWTLESFYKQSRKDIMDKVLAILNTPGLEVANGTVVLQAIVWYMEKNVDFIDAYNGAWILAQGLHAVYTFDRKHFPRLEGLRTFMPGE